MNPPPTGPGLTIILLIICCHSSNPTSSTSTQPSIITKVDNSPQTVRNKDGDPTTLLLSTPYSIKNVATGILLVHRNQTQPDLFTLSHWWELLFVEDPNIYLLHSMDPSIISKFPKFDRKIQLRQVGLDRFTLHPINCPNESRNSSQSSFIYYNFIDENGRDQIICTHTQKLESSIIESNYEYIFTPVSQVVSTLSINANVTILSITTDHEDIIANILTSSSVKSSVFRKDTITNCGTGKVKQEVLYSTETTARTRIRMEKTLQINSFNSTKSSIGVGGGITFFNFFTIGGKVSKPWSEEATSNTNQKYETTFTQEETTQLNITEKVFVGPKSCVQVNAWSSVLENVPLYVDLLVKLELVGENFLLHDDRLSNYLKLAKLNGVFDSYDAKSNAIFYQTQAKMELSTLVLSNVKIVQVDCKCNITRLDTNNTI